MWPPKHSALADEKIHALAEKALPAFLDRLRQLRVNDDLRPWLESVYLPLAAWIARHKRGAPLIAGINGAQGTGKSTLAALLTTLLSTCFDLKVAGLSIDDLYLTRAEREHLAATIHPLLRTRGVPGTHDVELGIKTLGALQAAGPEDTIPLPVFDKALDDRKPLSQWPVWRGEVDIILFEGWCVGARPQPRPALDTPINELERREDPDGRWRRYVNEQLEGPYQRLFAFLDHLIMLKVPSMECVFRWRLEQERKLAEFATDHSKGRLKLMNERELHRFIQHYERLTRWMLEEMPRRADIVLELGIDHQIHRIEVNRNGCPP